MSFWREKTIEQMTEAEWESLCDGCGLCCQLRLEDEDTGEIVLSNIACRYLDLCSHRCTDYPNRQVNVPDCMKVTPQNVHGMYWLPATCAYRLVAAGEELPRWHRLVSGDGEGVHREGISMQGELVSEEEADWESLGVDPISPPKKQA